MTPQPELAVVALRPGSGLAWSSDAPERLRSYCRYDANGARIECLQLAAQLHVHLPRAF